MSYTISGDAADLEAAIDAFQQAVRTTPLDAHDRYEALNNLGVGLRERYTRTKNMVDLEAAIDAFQQAIQASPSIETGAIRPRYNLGVAFLERYIRTRKRPESHTDLETAIDAFQQAVRMLAGDARIRPMVLNSLGAGLLERYERAGELSDLEAATDAFQQAIRAVPPTFHDRPMYLNGLGIAFRKRSDHTNDLADLEAGIGAFQQAVRETAVDSPLRALLLDNLSKSLYERLQRTADVANLNAVIAVMEESWSSARLRFASLPVTYQLGQQDQGAGIARNLITAYLSRARGNLLASKVLIHFMKPLLRADDNNPRLTPGVLLGMATVSLLQAHEKRGRRSFVRLTSAPPRAMEVAEESKSRLLTQLVGREHLPPPVGPAPDIVAQEQHLLVELSELDSLELAAYDRLSSSLEEAGGLGRIERRRKILGELEDIWARIAATGASGADYVAMRRMDTPSWKDFIHVAKTLGSDTALLSLIVLEAETVLFLLRAGWNSPRIVAAPLNQSNWTNLQNRLFQEVHRFDAHAAPSETWDQPLRPLLTGAQQYLKGVKRLIFAPVGAGHLFPWPVLVERAGWHAPGNQPLPVVTVPALGVLTRLRQRPRIPGDQALVIGNPLGDLPHAENEARMVAERFGTTPLLGTAATKQAVLDRLEQASFIHLATHAFFSPTSPLDSGIILASREILTAREILTRRLRADVLVLSACKSGQVGSLGGEELAGLSQSFLQAGARSLLVSLWQVRDTAAAVFMQAFYDTWQAGADKAQALRQAMTQVQQDPDHPRWRYEGYQTLELPDDFAAKLPQGALVFLYHSHDDEIAPFSHLALYARLLPKANVREVARGGHQLNNDLTLVATDIRGLA